MRLCILETNDNAGFDLDGHGSFADMFIRWLSPVLPEAQWTPLAVYRGAALPDPQAFDGYLVTGSRHGVYDDLPWIAPLAAFLRRLRDLEIPLAGVCFGHQVMAHAFGARVEKSAGGWVLGPETYDGLTALALHQDLVLSVPPGARRSRGSARCAIGRLDYAFPALSVQYHPEFSAAFLRGLIAAFSGKGIAPDIAEAALARLDAPTDVARIAQDFAALFRTRAACAAGAVAAQALPDPAPQAAGTGQAG